MSTLNPIQIVENKLSSWPLASMSKEDQVKELTPLLRDTITSIVLSKDHLETITVHEDIFEAVSECLGNMTLNESFVDPAGASWEESNKQFSDYCKSIAVRTAPTGYFAQAESTLLESASPEQIFINIVTSRQREFMALKQFDMKHGISAQLQKSGLGIQPTYEEFKLLCMIAALFEQDNTGSMDSNAILQATAGPDFKKIIGG